jgi:hypothetical protein
MFSIVAENKQEVEKVRELQIVNQGDSVHILYDGWTLVIIEDNENAKGIYLKTYSGIEQNHDIDVDKKGNIKLKRG